jgi:hypothetical protein
MLDCFDSDVVEIIKYKLITHDDKISSYVQLTAFLILSVLVRTTVEKTMGEHFKDMVWAARETIALYETTKGGIAGDEYIRRVARIRQVHAEHRKLTECELEALTLLAAASGNENLTFLHAQSYQLSLKDFTQQSHRVKFTDELLKLGKSTARAARPAERPSAASRSTPAQVAKPSTAIVPHLAQAVKPVGKFGASTRATDTAACPPCAHCGKLGHSIER